jgi:hypothetical protein
LVPPITIARVRSDTIYAISVAAVHTETIVNVGAAGVACITSGASARKSGNAIGTGASVRTRRTATFVDVGGAIIADEACWTYDTRRIAPCHSSDLPGSMNVVSAYSK